MCVSGIEQGAHFMEWFLEFSIRLSVKEGRTRLHAIKADHAAHGRALSRTVWPKKTCHTSGLHGKGERVNCNR